MHVLRPRLMDNGTKNTHDLHERRATEIIDIEKLTIIEMVRKWQGNVAVAERAERFW